MMIHFCKKKTNFEAWSKHHFSLYLEGTKLSLPWGFQVWWSQWYKFQSCMMNMLLKKTHFGLKASLSFVFSGPNSVHSEVFRCDDHNGTTFKAVWWSVSEKNTFWAKTSLFFIVRGPNSVHSEVFRSDDHNGTSFKAAWWSIAEKTHFGLKHPFILYLEYQTQFTLRFSGVMITVVQVSKLYDEPASEKKHILGQSITFLCI